MRLASSLRHLLNHPQLKRTSLHALVRLEAMHVSSTKPAAGDAPQLAGGSAVSTASERASDSDAAQLAYSDAPPSVPLSSLSGNIYQYGICYPCALGKEIMQNGTCRRCGNTRHMVLMVASPETWPANRAATSCYRCKCHVNLYVDAEVQGIYAITQSAESWGNMPVCSSCYGVGDPVQVAAHRRDPCPVAAERPSPY